MEVNADVLETPEIWPTALQLLEELDTVTDDLLSPQQHRILETLYYHIQEVLDIPEDALGALRLSNDLRAASKLLSPQQQRILVDHYYQVQEARKRAANQLRYAKEEPNEWVAFMALTLLRLEKLVAGGLDIASNQQAVSRWAKEQVGIGSVLAAGLAAHIDITKTPSVSALWSLAGLNPDAVWAKGELRPWNSKLKNLRWKIGDSFMKFHNHKDCIYGHLYAARKQLEVQRNAAGLFREQAEKTLATRNIRDKATRAIYEAGQLPAGRLELRAERVAVKRFLAHYWSVAYYEHYGKIPPRPYILAAQPGIHTHYVPPPGYENILVYP